MTIKAHQMRWPCKCDLCRYREALDSLFSFASGVAHDGIETAHTGQIEDCPFDPCRWLVATYRCEPIKTRLSQNTLSEHAR